MKQTLICVKRASSGLCTANLLGQTLMLGAWKNFKQEASTSQVLTKLFSKLYPALQSSRIFLSRNRMLVKRNGRLGLRANSGSRLWLSKSLIFMTLKRQGILTKDRLNYSLEKLFKCLAILMNFSTLSSNLIKAQQIVA